MIEYCKVFVKSNYKISDLLRNGRFSLSSATIAYLRRSYTRMASTFRLLFLLTFPLLAMASTSDFSSQQLLAIAQSEMRFYQQLESDPKYFSEADKNRKVNAFVADYRRYLRANPQDADAYVLYGKLLRRLSLQGEAFTAFLKADELDPNLAIAKQQIGNHLAETGNGKAALPFFLAAIELDSKQALHHFNLGQLLAEYKSEFLAASLYDEATIDAEMLHAFRQSTVFDPDDRIFKMRLAEAYYDVAEPNWSEAKQLWNELLAGEADPLSQQIIHFNLARVSLAMNDMDAARFHLDLVRHQSLEADRLLLLEAIGQTLSGR